MAAALCYGVRDRGVQLAFHVRAGNYDTDSLIGVLEGLRKSWVGRRPRCCGTGCPPTAAPPCGLG
jgi:hypothetical protein